MDFPNASYLSLSTLSLKICKNGCDWSIFKGSLLGKQVHFSAVSRLPLEVFSLNFIPRTLQHALKTMYVSSHNSVALVRERTIPTEPPPPVGEVSANFCG